MGQTDSRRPALHDDVAVDMTNSRDKLIRQGRVRSVAWMDRVEQIRVRATVGDRLPPQALELIVITVDQQSRSSRGVLGEGELAVRVGLAGQPKHPLADDVALDLVAATGDADRR